MACTYFISDCHLSASRPAVIDCFIRFIDSQAQRADALYVLGDLFDYWLGDGVDPGQKLKNVQSSLLRLAQHAPIYFIHGNHDFLISERFARQSGLTLLKQFKVINLYGENTLITHGDLLCSDDRMYQRYRRVAQHPLSKLTLNRLPAPVKLGLAGIMRKISAQKKSSAKAKTVDVRQETVIDVMRRYAVSRLIHGHTHQPDIHTFRLNGKRAQRIVLGDWYRQGNVLSVDEQNRIRFESLKT